MAGYKMVGNAVSPYLVYYLAKKIYEDLRNLGIETKQEFTVKNHRVL